MNSVKQCPKHTFMFLTKNPLGYLQYEFLLNCWLGFTDNGQLKKEDVLKIRNRHKNNIIFVSLEPFIRYDIGIVKLVDWIIIGGWSQPGKHKIDWLAYESLINYCDQKDISLFVKSNMPLMENYGYHYCIRQCWPEEVLGETTI